MIKLNETIYMINNKFIFYGYLINICLKMQKDIHILKDFIL